MNVKTEYFHCGTRIVVTGDTADLVQSETTRIMDDIENGSTTFTMPVRQADGQWMAAGHRELYDTPASTLLGQCFALGHKTTF